MKHLALLTIILIAGCTNVAGKYEESRMSALDAWEEVIGPVSDECYDRAISAMVVESGRFPKSCMPGDPYIGCYFPSGITPVGTSPIRDTVFVYKNLTEKQKARTVVHEFGHLLHFCEKGGWIDIDLIAECAVELIDSGEPGDDCRMPGDYFHLDETVWDDYGKNTVESVGKAKLEEL